MNERSARSRTGDCNPRAVPARTLFLVLKAMSRVGITAKAIVRASHPRCVLSQYNIIGGRCQ